MKNLHNDSTIVIWEPDNRNCVFVLERVKGDKAIIELTSDRNEVWEPFGNVLGKSNQNLKS